jgi:hypothetical protein
MVMVMMPMRVMAAMRMIVAAVIMLIVGVRLAQWLTPG